MPVINTQQNKGGSTAEFTLLPTDVYRMKITKAVIEENRFAEPLNDGTKPQQLVLTWEVTQLTEDQEETSTEAEEDWSKAAVWQRLAPWYGEVRAGGPSRFKAFIDALREQGYLENFNPALFDIDNLLGIEQRISVEKYIKGQGENAGKPGNKVVSVLPLRRTKGANGKMNGKKEASNDTAPGVVGDEDLPF